MIGNWNYGTGRRKSSVARVFMKKGTGQILVNGTFTFALMVGLSVGDTTLGTLVANLGYDKLVMPKPVFIGDTLRAALRLEGHAVDWVRDLAAANATLASERFDLVLLDLGLPAGGPPGEARGAGAQDGLDLLRTLRADPLMRDIPVVVVSADALGGQVDAALQAGALRYLTKPVNVSELLRTVDALLVFLLSGAFGIPTHYRPELPLVPVYRKLLDHWRTPDPALFGQVMQAAARFHIECSGDGTEDRRYEFEAAFAQAFPLELLVVQALRQRDGLPAFDTGHALVDAPWALLKTLPPAPLNPLLARLDRRLRQDYSAYR